MARYSSSGQNLIEDEYGNVRPRVPQIIDASAPMHDFSKDKPMTSAAPAQLTGPSLTPAGLWNQLFQPRGAATSSSTPTLSVLAQGGQNHAQKWMSAAEGQQNVAKYQAPGTIASTTYDNTPGTRQPFIAGANGLNVASSIAAKLPDDPTLDKRPEWMRQFSWSSAFNR